MSGSKMPEREALDPFDLVGDVIDGQFRVDAVAGEGSLSLVYRGWHQSMATRVAIKCLNLPATLDPQLVEPFVQSFLEGAKITYQLSRGNLNIAQSLASGSTLAPRLGHQVPYLVREWFEGQSLAATFAERRAKKPGRLTLDEIIGLLDGAADGLGFAHAQGVSHHSVNPTNLFVVESGGHRKVKVLDFSLAKAANASGVVAGLRVLPPEYAAPEQIDRQLGAPGPWTDVYSFALIVMEGLIGAPVFASKEAAPAAQIDPVHRPSARLTGLGFSKAVRESLDRAVALDPRKRPANVTEFWNALKAAAGPRPTSVVTAVSKPPAPAALSKPPPLAAVSRAPPPATAPAVAPRAPRADQVLRKTIVGLGTDFGVASAPPTAGKPAAAAMAATPAPEPAPELNPTSEPLAPPDPVSATTLGVPAPLASTPRVTPPAMVAPLPPPFAHEAAALPPFELAPAEPVTPIPSSTPELPVRSPFEEPSVDDGTSPASPGRGRNLDDALRTVRPRGPLERLRPSLVVAATSLRAAWSALSGRLRRMAASPEAGAQPQGLQGLRTLVALSVALSCLALLALLVLAVYVVGVTRRAAADRGSEGRGTEAPQTAPVAPPAAAPSVAGAPAAITTAVAASARPGLPASPDRLATGPVATPTKRLVGADAYAALDALSAHLDKCARSGGRSGRSAVWVTFERTGRVSHIKVGPPLAGTPEGKCVTELYRGARVGPFLGPPGAVIYKFTLPEAQASPEGRSSTGAPP